MHYELSLAGSNIDFAPGDSFGVHPLNDPGEVARLILALALDADAEVRLAGEACTLSHALMRLDLQQVTDGLARALAEAGGPAGAALAEGSAALDTWRGTRFVWEAASEHPGSTLTAQQLVDHLRRLQARLYSVANSALTTPESVHFTVETLRYSHDGFARTGVASTWLCDRCDDSASVPVHLVPGRHFRLPEEGSADIICVGPGTGIAPFRAFLQHREARGDSGRTWLFFGHQSAACDALYADELEGFAERGVLTTLTCAWSRDQAHKVYVQHRLEESGAEVYAWLDGGGLFYVCGDRLNMAGDVRKALVRVAEQHGGHDAEAAEAWVKALEDGDRYRIDVY
jgi:sulfite reductase (NADPH) flavoprotein alpha-component